ncbi:MAG: sigma-E factor negative regulatory protein [Wenzhouxiangella sp.]
MTEVNREQLSCLMDGELERRSCDFLVRRLATDPALSDRWQRYHLIRACLQRELSSPAGLAERVAAALDEETPMPAETTARRWLKPLGGVAIAASVAVAALVGMNSSMLEQGQSEHSVSEAGFVSQSTPLDRPFNQPLVPVSLSESSAADRQRINSYLLRHNQAVGSAGFPSYVPIVVGAGSLPAAAAAGASEPGAAETGGR